MLGDPKPSRSTKSLLKKKCRKTTPERRHHLRPFKIICEAERPNALNCNILKKESKNSDWARWSCIRALGLIRFQDLAQPSVGLEAYPHKNYHYPLYKQVCDSHRQCLGWRVSGSLEEKTSNWRCQATSTPSKPYKDYPGISVWLLLVCLEVVASQSDSLSPSLQIARTSNSKTLSNLQLIR